MITYGTRCAIRPIAANCKTALQTDGPRMQITVFLEGHVFRCIICVVCIMLKPHGFSC